MITTNNFARVFFRYLCNRLFVITWYVVYSFLRNKNAFEFIGL